MCYERASGNLSSMQKVLTAAEMREVDRLTTEEYGIPSIVLMENAAHAVVRVIADKLGGSVKGKSILVLCGEGNNGGDGAAIARILFLNGAKVEAYVLGNGSTAKEDARTNFEILRCRTGRNSMSGGELEFGDSVLVDYWVHTSGFETGKFDVIVDALFGTGLTRPLNSVYQNVPLTCSHPQRKDGSLLISVDIPSGLNSDSNELPDIYMKPDCTVTFTAPKPGNVLPGAAAVNGELFVADIGSPPELIGEQPSNVFLAEQCDVGSWLQETRFSDASYKNKRGHALLIAGSENYSGAAVLCGNAAIRSGVGLVTIGTPRSSKDSIAGRVVPEVMVRPLAETDTGSVAEEAFEEIEGFSDNVDAIAIGSGLAANNESTKRLVRRLVKERTMPTVLDADALTLLSPFDAEEIKDENKPPLILTPHQGEFLKMLGTKDAEAIKDRVAAVREFAQKHHVILVLKGERNLIAEPGGKVVVNPTGNSGLGKAGNGDTLTGIIAGFAAQAAAMEVDMFETVVAAVYIAGLAGDIAEKKFGKRVMTASDVKDCLREAFETVEQQG